MSTCSPTVGAHVRPWEMINNQRPPRRGATYEKASLRGNGGSIVATKGYLHTAISPPRCCRTYAIAPRSVLIAPRPDMAFDRTYRWPLPSKDKATPVQYWCTAPVAASYILLHQKATAHTILKTFAGPYTARRDLSKNATKLFSTP